MKREEVKELHYITAIENVASILQRGILSHRRAERVAHSSVAMQEVQDRRSGIRIPNARALHEYANLYFCARNPMLFLRRNVADTLCVLRVDSSVVDLAGVILTDGNAASGATAFYPSPTGLSKIDREMVFAKYWVEGNGEVNTEKKRVKCAEVLVPDRVEASLIIGAHVRSAVARLALATAAPTLAISHTPDLFFS
jgi:hypothetical protein